MGHMAGQSEAGGILTEAAFWRGAGALRRLIASHRGEEERSTLLAWNGDRRWRHPCMYAAIGSKKGGPLEGAGVGRWGPVTHTSTQNEGVGDDGQGIVGYQVEPDVQVQATPGDPTGLAVGPY